MSDCLTSCACTSRDKTAPALMDSKVADDSGLGEIASPEYMPTTDTNVDDVKVEFKDEMTISKLENFSDYDLSSSLACCSTRNEDKPFRNGREEWSDNVEGFPFGKLPDHIKLKVFTSFEPQDLCAYLTPVCKEWHKLAYSPVLWRRIELSLDDLSQCWNVKRVLTKATQLESMTLYLNGFGVNNELILGGQLIPYMPCLAELNMRFIRGFDLVALDFFMDQCPNITVLNLEGVKDVTDKSVQLFSKVWKNLQVLNLSHCENLTDASLESLGEYCTQITKLNIDGVNKVTDLGIEAIMRSFGGNLVELRLDGEDLTDLALWCIADWAKKVTVLTLSFSEQLTDTALNYVQRMPQLTHLHLRKGMDFTASAMIGLFNSNALGNMKHLNMAECHGINDEVVDAITRNCPNLETLCLSWCWTITDVGLRYIAERLRELVILDLLGSDQLRGFIFGDAPELYFEKLIYLDLRQCNVIEDAILEQLVNRKRDIAILNYYGEVLSHDIEATMPRNAMYELKQKIINKYEGKCCITSL